jgi:hypothetical protein
MENGEWRMENGGLRTSKKDSGIMGARGKLVNFAVDALIFTRYTAR